MADRRLVPDTSIGTLAVERSIVPGKSEKGRGGGGGMEGRMGGKISCETVTCTDPYITEVKVSSIDKPFRLGCGGRILGNRWQMYIYDTDKQKQKQKQRQKQKQMPTYANTTSCRSKTHYTQESVNNP